MLPITHMLPLTQNQNVLSLLEALRDAKLAAEAALEKETEMEKAWQAAQAAFDAAIADAEKKNSAMIRAKNDLMKALY